MLMEYQQLDRLWNALEKRHTLTLPTRKYDCPDIAAEKEYVRNTIARPKETIKEAMLVSRTWKVYFTLFKARTFALKDVNFSVRKGECFGVLGMNGCGKTTAFKVMTRKEFVTKGIIFGNGYFANENATKYIRKLGYSHQTFGLDFFRSGEKNLRTLMVLRGITREDIKIENNTWFKIIGLEQFRHYTVTHYSGGMAQRLTAGAALCGGAPVMLLDGPTAGVDPAARRLVWEALEHGLTYGRSIILSSHNMEEVERLCNNLTLLDAGEMGVIGTPSNFKLSYARGHTVLIKLRVDSVLTAAGASKVQALKDFMATEFNSALKDDHMAALRYMISARVMYSEIFNKLTCISRDFEDIIEDFETYDGNMEDGFMQFVHDSRFNLRQKQTW
ncbi:linearmycin resistance ATP-binding protein LnrL-like [Battus philenor]|uniref:linearmycin resistance ATP-binding protein LnrL-like n=1 Tax=Battus philenor TaxID=42288 RepID=UPI0035CF81E7